MGHSGSRLSCSSSNRTLSNLTPRLRLRGRIRGDKKDGGSRGVGVSSLSWALRYITWRNVGALLQQLSDSLLVKDPQMGYSMIVPQSKQKYSLNRSMDSDKYLEGQSMQRPPLFEKVVPFEEQSDDLKKKLAKNNEAKMVLYNALPKKEYERIFMCKTAKDIWQSLLITHQGNSQVKDNKIDLLVQQYEQFTILEEESIDSGFARFNTIITSLKALDEGFSSKNYVRKFLRALHPKWRANLTPPNFIAAEPTVWVLSHSTTT
ncbi:hypothetical protein Tco_0976426 [Tanacetum coccineum]|uniref:DUF4219 domain-containing protein/UBN2 domain-containing protein n=1 Tax=Tanacetum coccineum TaxID=301880 RepID=A0ABQ5EH74_9ASTR